MDVNALTPMMKQYFSIKNQYKDYILFYRLGDFYEMFFEDAVTASKVLEITLTGRNCGLEEKAPLCGIPYHSAEGYIGKLIKNGYKVAICEQIEDPKAAKGIVKRDVIRVITPGTVIDSSMLEEKNNNFLLSIYDDASGNVALSYSDITTGKLKGTEFTSKDFLGKILDEINKINPTEILISKDGLHNKNMSTKLLEMDYLLTEYERENYNYSNCKELVLNFFKVFSIDSIGLNPDSPLVNSTGALINYIKETQKVDLIHFDKLEIYNHSNFMILDTFTRRNLELTETIRGKDKKGSLMWILDKSSTSMGSRMLKSWIEEPLLDVEKIEDRLLAVESLVSNTQKRDEIKNYLSSIYDLERLSSKLVFGNVNCRDLVALKNSIGMLPYIRDSLSDISIGIFSYIREKFDSLDDVYKLIDESIIDDPPITIKDGGMIKTTYSKDVAELRDALENGKKWILDVENRERDATGIKSLKIGFNKVFGYYIDVTRANSSLVPDSYIRKQTLANSERYITPELKELEEKVLGAEDKIKAIEYEIFNNIKEKILMEVNRIKNMGKLIAMVDVITAFSEVAFKNSYCKPEVNASSSISILEGRHPVVEKLVKTEMFVANDTILDNDDNRMYIITGPNMAGKSTYLRQVALITLMAQIGSFVPAKEALVGVVDRIFTRVGASDDLSQGQSTFMVEMSELANILHNASSKSLIILDEIGRGTSTYDGLSIAWSVVEFLSKNSGIRSKSMFATHYHELTEIEGKIDGVKNYSILAKEVGDDIVFLRKIVKGRANQSFGIQVAKLAGVPHLVTERANQILKKLEENDINSNIKNLKNEPQISFFNEVDIFSSDEKEVIDIIKGVDIGNTTPVDALNILYNLKKKID